MDPKFREVILKQLNIDDFELKEEMVAKDVPGWDSLNHAQVILSLEDAFNIRLKNLEVLNCENLGDLQELVRSKIR